MLIYLALAVAGVLPAAFGIAAILPAQFVSGVGWPTAGAAPGQLRVDWVEPDARSAGGSHWVAACGRP